MRVMQLAHLAQHHRVAEVNVGRGRVQAELDAQRNAGGLGAGEFGDPVRLGQELFAAAARNGERIADAIRDGIVQVWRGDGV